MLIVIIISLIVMYVLEKLPEWLACSRTTPDGYETDWLQMSEDTRKYGKDYTFRQINNGKYNKKIEK